MGQAMSQIAPSPSKAQQDPNKWLADLIAHLWPYASNAIEALANDMIPDILAASRPSFVHDLKLKKFELGKARPKLTNLRQAAVGEISRQA